MECLKSSTEKLPIGNNSNSISTSLTQSILSFNLKFSFFRILAVTGKSIIRENKVEINTIKRGRSEKRVRKNLKEARQRAGMTQQQMAKYLNITLSYYQMIEKGDRVGAVDLWDKLEDLFSVHQRKLREIL